ncbi:MAG: hypothetical protein QOK39_877, partial [Acidimicrobiaceae bacterium]|nr:hypothetical protein [Acidimicrobiaceae bacterium]
VGPLEQHDLAWLHLQIGAGEYGKTPEEGYG